MVQKDEDLGDDIEFLKDVALVDAKSLASLFSTTDHE